MTDLFVLLVDLDSSQRFLRTADKTTGLGRSGKSKGEQDCSDEKESLVDHSESSLPSFDFALRFPLFNISRTTLFLNGVGMPLDRP